MEKQTLKVAGNKNIHRGRKSGIKLAVAVIFTGFDKVGEYVVFIGSTDKLLYRHTHILGIICGKYVSEISRGNHNVKFVILCKIAVVKKGGIGIYIVYYLRNKTTPVDGICARE